MSTSPATGRDELHRYDCHEGALVMPIKDRSYQLTEEVLREYMNSALSNARSLLEEAELLLAHNHYARSYFLAVSCIEETGKAVQAFDGLGRNLKDPAVAQRLKMQFEDHSQKVASAFCPWIQSISNLRDEIMGFVNVMVDIGIGREAAMYTDVHVESGSVTTPKGQIRVKAASDCVSLAGTVLHRAVEYTCRNEPKRAGRIQDAFFALKPFHKIASTKDFWEYYVSKLEAGQSELESAVLEYNERYFSRKLLFKPHSGGQSPVSAAE